jgi:hypothetical protein
MSPKRKLHKLNLDYKPDFILIGIASHENDYRISWVLNKELGFSFVKTDDLVIYKAKFEMEIPYSRYFLSNEPDLSCYLISNKSEKGFLLSKMKNIDFVLRISMENGMDFIDDILLKLKKIDIIITAFIIENLTEKDEKLFEF